MTADRDRRYGTILGAIAAILLVLDGIVSILRGFLFLAFGYGFRVVTAEFGQSIVFIGLGILVGLLAFFGRRGVEDRPMIAGIGMIVLAIVGWFALGLGGGLLGILSAVLMLLSGVFFLIGRR
jgi:hypothetical protein